MDKSYQSKIDESCSAQHLINLNLIEVRFKKNLRKLELSQKGRLDILFPTEKLGWRLIGSKLIPHCGLMKH